MRGRVLLADESAVFRRFLRRVLEKDFDIVGSAADGIRAIELTRRLAPDLVLLGLAVMGGLEVIHRITEAASRVKVIVLSMHNDPAYVEEALKAGASGFLLKCAEHAELVAAVHHVMAGEVRVGEGLLARARDLPAS